MIKYLLPLLLTGFLSACSYNKVQNKKVASKKTGDRNYFMKLKELQSVYESAEELDFIRSFIIWKDDEVISEAYFQNYSGDSLDHLRSQTKSIISILIGIAIDQKLIQSVDDPIQKYIGHITKGYKEKKQAVTIKQLLTMMSGFEWDESDVDEFNNWMRAGDQIHYLLKRDIVDKPGTKFSYNSANPHLLSVILTTVSKMSTLEFANKYLFHPLGINNIRWKRVSDGYYSGGASLEMKPGDLLKIGVMMLNNGEYKGRRIVSEEWISESTKAHFTQSKEDAYGYLWWLQNFEGNNMYTAAGFGGQYLIINPKYQAVISITSQWRNRHGKGPAYIKDLKEVMIKSVKTIQGL